MATRTTIFFLHVNKESFYLTIEIISLSKNIIYAQINNPIILNNSKIELDSTLIRMC